MTNIKIAIRNILKGKTESLISILGLGIGLGCIMILLLLTIHEYSFDRYIPDHQRAFRVLQGENCTTPYQLGSSIKKDIPGISDFFRFFQVGEVQIKDKPGQITFENFFGFSDPSIYKNLGIEMKYGQPAITDYEMAISESMANKYFNRNNVVGESMLIKLNNDFINITISGVYKDFPSNSTLSPNFIANLDFSKSVLFPSNKFLGDYSPELDEYRSWKNNYFYTYLFLDLNIKPETVTEKIQEYTKLLDQEKWADVKYKLQPVADIYFKSNDFNGNTFSKIGNVNDLKYYLGIAFVILCIAIINYIFLTRAKIIGRLNEMGAKKALGATNRTIRRQIFFESNLIALLAVIPAILVVATGIPFINNILGKELGTEVLSMWHTWFVIILVVLMTGSLSGLFIGGSISQVSVVLLLSGRTSRQRTKHGWSNSFLSFHFAILIILIVSLLTFKKQISYSLTDFKNINPDNVLICELNTPELQKNLNVLKNELIKNSDVIKIAGSSLIPPTNWFLPVKLKYEDQEIKFDGLIMGEGMIELLEMQIIEGESFGEYQKNVLIINESTAKKYNVKPGGLLNGIYIKGVVKDFMAHTLYEPIKPMVILQQHPEKMRLMAVKTTGNNHQKIISDIHKLYGEISPGSIVNIKLMKDEINQFYSREQNQAKLIGAFSILAVLLSLMGLLGIVLVSISKRIKEIGIRKVNGANVSEVLIMLNAEFVKWVILAIVISIPVSWYIMKRWLQNFAFQTEISWWIFTIAGVLAICIAVLTISWESFQTARRNPVEALRYE